MGNLFLGYIGRGEGHVLNFSVSAVLVWNLDRLEEMSRGNISGGLGEHVLHSIQQTAELLSTLITNLFDIAYSEREQSASCLPLCACNSLALYCAV